MEGNLMDLTPTPTLPTKINQISAIHILSHNSETDNNGN